MRYRRFGLFFLGIAVLLALFYARSASLNAVQSAMLDSARGCLGDAYDSSAYTGGSPPRGRGACTDVIYYALAPILDLQAEVNRDIISAPSVYNSIPNPDLDYRWCPTLIKWFRRHWAEVPLDRPKTHWYFHAGDVVFFDDGSGVPGHVGLVSDRLSWDGKPLLIHNPGPFCVEENALGSNRLLGHFRMVSGR